MKSVLTSLVFADVDQKDVLITTVNQWFDKSIFLENSIKTIYYPSVDTLKIFKIIKKNILKFLAYNQVKITILTYDALGLIYYVWYKKNYKINSIKDFLIKDNIKGKIGTFSFLNGQLFQKLDIYKISEKKICKILIFF